MAPAFTGPRQAAAFAALLLALMVAPALVANAGILDRSSVYPTMPVYAGPFSHIQREIFERSDPLDMVFVGSSFMWSAIDAPYVQQELSRALGRDARVSVLASVWPGLDRDYAILRDLLSRRRVEMVVLQLPQRRLPTDDPAIEVNTVSNQPHVQAFRFFRHGEFESVSEGLALTSRASLYGGAVLGLPRHLLTLGRPNLVTASEVEHTLGARFEARGYYGAPYQRFRPDPPAVPWAQQRLSPTTRQTFSFHDEELPHYQMHFVRQIAGLLAQYEVPTVLIHIPMANEIDATVVQERMDWTSEMGMEATMLGIPPARLFEGLSREETLRLFVSDHLNDNGAYYYSRALTPALIEEFNRQ